MHKVVIHATFHAAVSEELRKADEQHGDAGDLYEMLAVLGEEYGELQKAVLQFDFEGGRREHILKECIQVGAMACKTFRFLMMNEALAPRVDFNVCPTCRRTKEERGRHEPLAGTAEVPWCPDPFHA